MKKHAINLKANYQLEPTVFAIFGGASDLTWRKLVPALAAAGKKKGKNS
jgi:glucose-6-phosphate 1-dehydrogenase